MSEYDDSGRIVLWKRDRKNDRSPVLGGMAYAHRDLKKGEAFEIALWPKKADSSERAPDLSGRLQDKREPSGRTSEVNPNYTPPPPTDYDIPF